LRKHEPKVRRIIVSQGARNQVTSSGALDGRVDWQLNLTHTTIHNLPETRPQLPTNKSL